MQRILHMSDFHVSHEMTGVNEKIENMVNFLKKNDLDINYIVFTGDAIDQEKINKEIINGQLAENKQSFKVRLEFMEKAYSNAIENFRYISSELNIPREHIFICCGNHDIIRTDNNNAINKNRNDCENNCIENMQENFDLFEKFCNEITGYTKNYESKFYHLNGFNFLIMNTNYKNDLLSENNNKNKENKMCIDCKKILSILEENKKLFINKDKNILLLHVPFNEICETTRYFYEPTKHLSTGSELKKLFGAILCGDKHAYDKDTNEILAGQPLREEYIIYNILEYAEGSDSYIQKPLVFKEGRWSIKYGQDFITKVISASLDYLKERLFHTFTWDRSTKVISARLSCTDYKMDVWENINKLYKEVINFKVALRRETEILKQTGDILSDITTCVNSSKNMNPVTLSGLPKVGKSTFLSFYYIYLLEKFMKGQNKYLPFYFNFEQQNAAKDNIDHSAICDNFKKFVENINEVKILSNLSAIIIIDGLSERNFYKSDITKKILEVTNEKFAFDKIIYSLDRNLCSRLEKSEIAQHLNSDYLLYLNPINLSTNFKEIYAEFIYAYKKLFDKNFQEDEFYNFALEDLKLSSIDLDLVTHYAELTQELSEITLTKVYGKYFNKVVDDTIMREIAPKAAYALMYNKKVCNYNDLHRITNIDLKTFKIIKNHRHLIYYLIAEYYVCSLEKFIEGSEFDSSILNHLVNKYEGQFIVDRIKSKNIQDRFVNYFDKLVVFKRRKPYFNALSTAIYISARIGIDQEKFKDLLGKVSKKCNECEEKKHQNCLEMLNARRSCDISKIVFNNKKTKFINDYLRKLIENKQENNLNRVFHRRYYVDTCLNYPLYEDDSIGEAFDFYNSYCNLKARIVKYIETEERYSLLEVDLFTLCSFVQHRLQHPYVSGKKNLNYFYNKGYPKSKKILVMLKTSINFYLKKSSRRLEPFIYDYFQSFLSDIDKFANNKKAIDMKETIKTIMTLFSKPRIGWKIEDNIEELTDDILNKLPIGIGYESVADHILSTYYLALLCLPNTLEDEPSYDKQKILNTILIHDIGESVTGDYPSFYTKYKAKKKEEDRFNRELFLKGTYDEVPSDLIYYYDLWDNLQSRKRDINSLIAKDFDIIQMLYKLEDILEDNKNIFSDERKKEFLQQRFKITTHIGKTIANTLLKKNND